MQEAADNATSSVEAAKGNILDAFQEAKLAVPEVDSSTQQDSDRDTAKRQAKTDKQIDDAVAGTKGAYESVRQATADALKGAAAKLDTK